MFGLNPRTDLEFVAVTGQAERDVTQLGTVYTRTTMRMTDAALKQTIAQGKLTAAVQRHGAQSRAAMQAELAYRNATRETTTSLNREGQAVNRLERDVGRLTRGALIGSGAARGLARAYAFGSTALLGGAGAIYALRTLTKAARDHMVAEGQLSRTVRNQGINYRGYSAEIRDTLKQQRDLTGFTEDDTLTAFEKFVRVTGDVGLALKATAIAGNVARGSGQGLDEISTKLVRGYLGQARGLAGLQIELAKGSKGWIVFEAANKQYHDSAQNFANTEAGSEARRNNAIHETEILIGRGLLPAYQKLNTRIADWLDKAGNQKRIQHDVSHAMQDGTKIVHGLVDAEKLIAPPIHAAIRALGGLENAVETAFILGVVVKARKAASALGLIGAASGKTRRALVADLAVEGAAVTGLRGKLAGLASKPFVVALALDVATNYLPQGHDSNPIVSALKGVPILGKSAGFGEYLAEGIKSQIPSVYGPQGSNTGYELTKKMHNLDAGSVIGDNFSVAQIKGLRTNFSDDHQYELALLAAEARVELNRQRTGIHIPSAAAGAYIDPTHLSAAQKRALDLQTHPKSLTALGAQATYDRHAIAFLNKRFAAKQVNSKTYIATHGNLENDLQAQEGSISSIEQAAAAARQAAAAKMAAARRKAAAAAKAAAAKAQHAYDARVGAQLQELRNAATHTGSGPGERGKADDRLTSFLEKESHDAKLSRLKRAGFRADLIRERKAEATDAAKAAATEKKRLAGVRATKEQDLQNAVLRAQLLTGPAELAAEKKGELALVNFYKAREKDAGATQAEIKSAQRKELEARLALKKLTAAPAASAAAFFAEAASEYATYGSNIGPRGSDLSGQDTRGHLARMANSLKAIERHVQTTAGSTTRLAAGSRISRSIFEAREAAFHGF